MSFIEDGLRRDVAAAEAKATATNLALDKAMAKLGDVAALAKTELDPTEHTRIMASVEQARVKHRTIRLLIAAVLVGWLATLLGGG